MYLKKELYALIQSDESIFDFIQNGSLDGLWYWDLENPENEWMNARFWTVLGYHPDEMPHKSSAWQSIINQDDLKVANENFVKHCEDPNYPYDQLVRYTHKDGSTKWIRCRGLAIRDNSGKPVRMLGAHQDVTELKRNEQELIRAKEKAEESEEKYRAMYNNAPLSYQSLDENGCFIDINPMWLRTLGYERDEVIGKWYGDFLHPDYVEHFRINYPAFKKRGYVSDIQFRLRRKDNTYIYVSFEGRVGYTPEGKFKQTYCVFKDITEQKALENAIIKAKERAEESEEKYRLLHENAGVGIGYFSTEGTVISFNSIAARHMYGKPEDFIGKSIFDIFPRENAEIYFNRIQLAKSSDSPAFYEDLVELPNGNKWFISTFTKIVNQDNDILGIQIISQDITELKNIEKKNQLLTTIIEKSQDFIGLATPDQRAYYVNPAGLKMMGIENEEMARNTKIEDYFLPEDLDFVYKTIVPQLMRDGRWVGEFRFRHFITGEAIDVYYDLFLTEDPVTKQVTNISTITRDITLQKKNEGALIRAKQKAEENESRYRDLIRNINAGVVVHAADTSVIMCNTRASELLGFSEAQMKGKVALDPQWKFVDEENTPIPIDDYPVMRIVKSKKSIHNQLVGVFSTNSDIAWLMVNGFPVLDDNEEISEIVISFIDITERKQAEIALLAKMDELERFHKLTVGREITMVELKKEINNLLKKLGEDPKYKIVE